ncbi:acyltransferase ChoActase/COT/CPT [Thamnocephalis sphaerospora]|uniref:Carnitine O-acetyltransferase, mitochondrial n=1 Tax=Thamnocephalis sphaerospora TaxID=78915 RepID=A0A4P9XM94_9FUNG|nr:acyltransferase ChoActase/COT/CPT [Thamnocephalis sphaerospora]|eukprot:RKP07018.1 acyltransferase ChoActase/COT/CPT [Thamnocephalis sphaerospora]
MTNATQAPSTDATVSRMDRGQDTMPKLPVPALNDTLDRYLASVRPLLDGQPERWERTQRAVEAFRSGDGPRLQKLLEDRAAASETSWLLDWWNEYAYFSNRESVCFYVNYCFGFRQDPRPELDWLTRAASLATGMLDFRAEVRSRELEPDAMRGQPFCMYQYNYLFNTCRIPAAPLDHTEFYGYDGNEHVAVVCRGRFYTFETVHADGTRLSTLEILHQLRRVYALATSKSAQTDQDADLPLGVLSADHRDVWAEKRTRLLAAHPDNAEQLRRIESAVFLICLDESRPETDAEFSRACWHGDGRNRFYDKCFQLLAFANGRCGFNGEHSLVDGTTTSRMCRFALERTEKAELPLGTDAVLAALATTATTASLPEPSLVTVQYDDAVRADIRDARATWESEAAAHDVSVLRHVAYGKSRMKRFNVSPDAYVQMAIQLAYYRMQGVCRSTYESAATRRFRYGRTETARSVSDASLAWVKAMASSSVSYSTKADMLRKAIATHSRNTVLAVGGQGVDRHLLGFRMLLAEASEKQETPDIFADPTYAYSTHWFLSTSQITDPAVHTYAWGEVVPDGYGIAYMVNDDFVYANICSKGLESDRMRAHFAQALDDIDKAKEAAKTAAAQAPVSGAVAAQKGEPRSQSVAVTAVTSVPVRSLGAIGDGGMAMVDEVALDAFTRCF